MDTDCAVVEDINIIESKDVLNSNTDDNDVNDDNDNNIDTTSVAVATAVAVAVFNGDKKRIEQHMESIFTAIRSQLSTACLLELLEVDDSIACSTDWVDYRSDAPGGRTLGR